MSDTMDSTTKSRGAYGGWEYVQLVERADESRGGFAEVTGYDGTESLLCEVWPGGDRAVLVTLPVQWEDAPGAVIRIEYPQEPIDALEPGRYVERVLLGAERLEVHRRTLRVISGPGTRPARVVYHTYKQLEDEYPGVDALAVPLKDETGFNELAGEARDWIDGQILDAAGRCGGWGPGWAYRTGSAYRDALTADGIDLATPGGKRIAKASVFRTLSAILRRAHSVTNEPGGLDELSERYGALAEAELDGVRVEFLGHLGLRSVRLGGMPTGRLER